MEGTQLGRYSNLGFTPTNSPSRTREGVAPQKNIDVPWQVQLGQAIENFCDLAPHFWSAKIGDPKYHNLAMFRTLFVYPSIVMGIVVAISQIYKNAYPNIVN